MHIIERMTCDLCGATYKGHFEVTELGVLKCVDCENPHKEEELHLGHLDKPSNIIHPKDDKLINTTYHTLLEGDMVNLFNRGRLYDGKSLKEHIYDYETQELLSHSVYFYNAPFKIVFKYRELAYMSLRYLDMYGEDGELVNDGDTEAEYREIADKLVEMYEMLRVRQLTEEEIQEYEEFQQREEVRLFKIHLEFLT